MNGSGKFFIMIGLIFSLSVGASIEFRERYNYFKNETETRLEKVDKKLEILTVKAKKEMQEQYKNLKKIKIEIEQKLKQAESQTSQNWEEAKKVIEKLASDLENKVDESLNS